jgi:type II secretion system (T2SS) protein E
MEKALSTRRLLGELLLESGVITKDQLWEALERQKSIGGRVGNILVGLGYVSESKLKEFLGRQLDIPILDLSTAEIERDAVKLIPAETARKLKVIPVRLENDSGRTVLLLVTSDPTNLEIADIVSFITGLPIQIAFAPEADIEMAIKLYYSVEIEPYNSEVDLTSGEYIKRTILTLVDLLEERGLITRGELKKRIGEKKS